MFHHASPKAGIQILKPRVSNHGEPRVYFSTKRENVLVYLSNPVEKYCKETGVQQDGFWYKWASYGFREGKVCLDEYYPNALEDTYRGVSGYIYRAEAVPGGVEQPDIPDAVYTKEEVPVSGCEFVEDACAAILEAERAGLIFVRRYEDMDEKMLAWIDKTIKREYAKAEHIPTYRHFLKGKFPEIIGDGGGKA